MDKPSLLLEVHEITLDRSDVFTHIIFFHRIDGSLVQRIDIAQDKSWDLFVLANEKWEEAKKKERDKNENS